MSYDEYPSKCPICGELSLSNDVHVDDLMCCCSKEEIEGYEKEMETK